MALVSAVILVVAATVFFTLFVRSKDIPQPEPKSAIYENLRDLQFEYRVGKLSDEDYQSTKLGLQKELAAVIGDIEKVLKAPAAKPAARVAAPKSVAKPEFICPHCGAKFAKNMRFCGECGKAMA
jgi:NADH pyrophosphatase NudC (nudix superfamily)